MKESFYYIDENGNKKKYVGVVTANHDGTYNGMLTKISHEEVSKNLEYHPEIAEVKAQHAYYSYVNSLGEEIMYFDNIKTDEEGNKYFTYTEKNMFKLEHVDEIPAQEEYYSYIDSEGNEQRYSGPLIKKGNKCCGLVTL